MNILFVSIAFPPKNDPECLQTARFFKYLSRECDLQLDVVTSSTPTLFMPTDNSLKSLDTGYHSKIEVPLYESKLTNFILRKIGLSGIMFPDSKMTFHWQWKRVVRKLKNKPDVIYSRSNPISSAFMALRLKKHFNVPWVMHFSDPWALSPLERSLSAKKLKAECTLIEEATKITFTTSETLGHYANQYPTSAHKFEVVPNVFDPDEVSAVEKPAGRKLRIVYTGGLAGMRSLFFLNDVLGQIQKKDPALLDKLEITVAGPMDRANAAFFERTEFSCISHVGELSYADAKELQRSAQILLVIDNPTNSSGAVFFPSKLLDYFLTGIKIMAVTPKGSVTARILENYPSVSFDRDEVSAMSAFMISEIQKLSDGEVAFRPGRPPAQYSANENAARLAEIFRAIQKV
jgi:hypothetical protein